MPKCELKLEDFEPYVAKLYSIGAMVADAPFTFDNEFGEGTYEVKPGDIILEGTCGEHWVAPVSKLVGEKAKYEIDGKAIDLADIARGHSLDTEFTKIDTKESTAITWAFRVPREYSDIELSDGNGHTLIANASGYNHGYGDYICCCDNGGKPTLEWGSWPVNGNVFPKTYEFAGKGEPQFGAPTDEEKAEYDAADEQEKGDDEGTVGEDE